MSAVNCCQMKYLGKAKSYIMVLFSISLYYFDIITDILVAKDLYDSKSQYFPTCIGIILLSVIGSALIQLFSRSEINRIVKNTANRNKVGGIYSGGRPRQTVRKITRDDVLDGFAMCCEICIMFTYFASQLPYLITSVMYFVKESLEREIANLKVIEALLESGPESLFQLFIIMNTYEENTAENMSTYYSSITISLLNLAYTMVEYEIKKYSWQHKSLLKTNKNVSYFKKYPPTLSLNSPFVFVLFCYRFTEIFSRAGLLASIGYVYDGNYIFYALAFDFVFINCLNSMKFILRVRNEERIFTMGEVIEDWDKIIETKQFIEKYSNHSRMLTNHVCAYVIFRLFRRSRGEMHKYLVNRMTIETTYKIDGDGKWDLRGPDEAVEHPNKMFYLLRNRIERRTMQLNHLLEEFVSNIVNVEAIDIKHRIIYKSIPKLLNSMKNLGVYSEYFSLDIFKNEYRRMLTSQFGELRGVPDDSRWWNKINMQFISKSLTGFVISNAIVRQIDIEDKDLFYYVSIGSVSCFYLQFPLLCAIKYWCNSNYIRAFNSWGRNVPPESLTFEKDVKL